MWPKIPRHRCFLCRCFLPICWMWILLYLNCACHHPVTGSMHRLGWSQNCHSNSHSEIFCFCFEPNPVACALLDLGYRRWRRHHRPLFDGTIVNRCRAHPHDRCSRSTTCQSIHLHSWNPIGWCLDAFAYGRFRCFVGHTVFGNETHKKHQKKNGLGVKDSQWKVQCWILQTQRKLFYVNKDKEPLIANYEFANDCAICACSLGL